MKKKNVKTKVPIVFSEVPINLFAKYSKYPSKLINL